MDSPEVLGLKSFDMYACGYQAVKLLAFQKPISGFTSDLICKKNLKKFSVLAIFQNSEACPLTGTTFSLSTGLMLR